MSTTDAPSDTPRESKIVTDEKVRDHEVDTGSGSEEGPERVAHVHAKTYLTVFAVCMLYFAQLINVVGAGAVSFFTFTFSSRASFTLLFVRYATIGSPSQCRLQSQAKSNTHKMPANSKRRTSPTSWAMPATEYG
jgi:hypothetical protein